MKFARSFFLLLMSSIAIQTFGQLSGNCIFSYGEFKENSITYLYGDKVNIRSKPGTDGSVVDNLPIGTEITVIAKMGDEMVWKGYSVPWYKVSYNIKGTEKEGFVCGAFLAPAYVHINESTNFLFGINEFIEAEGLRSSGKVVSNNKIISSADFNPIYGPFGDRVVFGHSVCAYLDGNHGLSGIKNVVRLEFTYEACGYENGEILLLWTGKEILYTTTCYRVSEAGIFHVSYELIFPDDPGGTPDMIKVVTTTEQYDEEGTSSFQTRREYKWTGTAILDMSPDD